MINSLLFLITWCILGLSGFIFWWINDYDFSAKDLSTSIGGMACGPFSWIVGWFIHGKPTQFKERIFFKKRKNKV